MGPEEQAFLDALLAAEARRKQREAVVNYQPTMADFANAPSDAVRGLLDLMLQGDMAVGDGMRYYLGPTGIPDKIDQIVGLLDPGVYDTGYAAADLIDPRVSPQERDLAARDVGQFIAFAPATFMDLPIKGMMRGSR